MTAWVVAVVSGTRMKLDGDGKPAAILPDQQRAQRMDAVEQALREAGFGFNRMDGVCCFIVEGSAEDADRIRQIDGVKSVSENRRLKLLSGSEHD